MIQAYLRAIAVAVIYIGAMRSPCLASGSEPQETPPCLTDFPVRAGEVKADVVVYGATPSGIMASIEAARLGKSVVVLEPSGHVGGMTASGVSVTDIGRSDSIGGLAREFFATVYKIYGLPAQASLGGTIYEPHIASEAFKKMLPRCNVRVITKTALVAVLKKNAAITAIVASDGVSYVGREYIDASYEGDLMAASGVRYTVGREANAEYRESLNGVGTPMKLLGQAVDPYVRPHHSESGLLPHIENRRLGEKGWPDSSVMAYCYRLCVTRDPQNRIPFHRPDNYDPGEFEVLARLWESIMSSHPVPSPPFSTLVILAPLPNGKFDLNSQSSFSTDYVGASVSYVDADAATRTKIASEHRRYTEAFLYFLQTSPRLPAFVNKEASELGLCKDEFVDNGGWPYLLYVREARRMVGSYVLTEDDVLSRKTITNSIGLGSFYFDCHVTNRVVVDGVVQNESNSNMAVERPYPIAYSAMTPVRSQARNLLVSVTVSATHAAFTSLRVEPTYMILGQAAGAAASLAIDENVCVQDVSYQALARQLKADGQILAWPASNK